MIKVFRHTLSLDEVRTISRIHALIGRVSNLSPLHSTAPADIWCAADSVAPSSVRLCIIVPNLLALKISLVFLPRKIGLILLARKGSRHRDKRPDGLFMYFSPRISVKSK